MIQLERLIQLSNILSARRYPIPFRDLLDRVDYSEATLKRYIRRLRDHGAPLRYDADTRGYILDRTKSAALHLPGFWFTLSELHALITVNELIDQLDPGLLKEQLVPIRTRIETFLAARGVSAKELSHRIRFIGMGIRSCSPQAFQTVATALIRRNQLTLTYHSRADDQTLNRTVSPQQLLYYRGNWYLAAFCHNRCALRALALDRMSDVTRLKTPCREVEEQTLKDHFFSSFGMFTGRPTEEAVLHFSQTAARWVAEEKWHPDQQGYFLPDGRYELRLPVADQRELIMEILRYGPDVRVMAPESLKKEVCRRLRQALGQYENKAP